MAGHSHWSQIKHKKALNDAKRSQLMSKLLRAITIAAREGNDPNFNPKLRSAIERAKKFQVPLENIERAIKKSEEKAENLEEVVYEAYFNDVQLLIKAITDNKNRTIGEIRHLLNKHNGRLADPGSVIWNFEERGFVEIAKKNINDELLEKILELTEFYYDIEEKNDEILLITSADKLNSLRNALEEKGIKIEDSYIAFQPKTTIEVNQEDENKVQNLIEELLNLDDVEEVFTNLKS